jgi:hypothetical protein
MLATASDTRNSISVVAGVARPTTDDDAPLTAMQMALVQDRLTGPDSERLKDAQTARDGGTRPRRAAARLGDGYYAGGRCGGSNRGQCGVERGVHDAPDTSGEPCSAGARQPEQHERRALQYCAPMHSAPMGARAAGNTVLQGSPLVPWEQESTAA